MQDMAITLTVSSSGLLALLIIAVAALRGWNGWLALKHAELVRSCDNVPAAGIGRIAMADLKERVRKLEAIAAGVDP